MHIFLEHCWLSKGINNSLLYNYEQDHRVNPSDLLTQIVSICIQINKQVKQILYQLYPYLRRTISGQRVRGEWKGRNTMHRAVPVG